MTAPRSRQRPTRRKALLHTTLAGKCPNCVFGDVFDGPLRARDACEVCGLPFDPDGSAWITAGFLVWVLAMTGLAVEGGLLFWLFGFFPGYGWVLGTSGALIVIASYRAARGFLVWGLWALGYLDG